MSFAHGSNDGQKGMGLIVLILVGILPGVYALKMDATHDTVHLVTVSAQQMTGIFTKEAAGTPAPPDTTKVISMYLKNDGKLTPETYAALAKKSQNIATVLGNTATFDDLPENQRRDMRTDFYLVSSGIKKLNKTGALTDPNAKKVETDFSTSVDAVTNYIPTW